MHKNRLPGNLLTYINNSDIAAGAMHRLEYMDVLLCALDYDGKPVYLC